jgi:serine/threonine protein kinase
MNDPPIIRRSRQRKPSVVSEIIERGSNALVGILRDNPSFVLKWPLPDDPEAIESFERERIAFERLGQHQYIVQLLWASERGLCLEYHPLRSIRHHYTENELPPLSQRLQWCRQAVSGFAFIHSKNIVHMDILARNILLSSDLDIKICDFGSAALLGERVRGLAEFRYIGGRFPTDWKATFKYDLFCMAALFYEVILGKPPYGELSRQEVIERYERQEFPSLNEIETCYSMVIKKCWYDEYSSIHELEEDLPLPPVA